jgi:hypothetical protein
MERMDLKTTSIYEPKIDMGSNILGKYTNEKQNKKKHTIGQSVPITTSSEFEPL